MFVIINSTTTHRINKSHLIDLYERVSLGEPIAIRRRVLSAASTDATDTRYATACNRHTAGAAHRQVDPAGGAVQQRHRLGEPRLATRSPLVRGKPHPVPIYDCHGRDFSGRPSGV